MWTKNRKYLDYIIKSLICFFIIFSDYLSRDMFKMIFGSKLISHEQLDKIFDFFDKDKNNKLDSDDFNINPQCDCHLLNAIISELPCNLHEQYSFSRFNDCDWFCARENSYLWYDQFGYSPLDQKICKNAFA